MSNKVAIISPAPELNELGLPLLWHWCGYSFCELYAPGDGDTDQTGEVDCPACLKRFETIKEQRAKWETK